MRSRSILRISLVAAALATSRAFVVPTARVLTPSFRRGVCSAMATSSPPHAVSEIRPPAVVGAPVESIETPALTLDLDIFEKNCDRMSDLLLRTPGVTLRPHVKAHKCPELAALQMQIARDRGVICQGVCAQQMREVEVMVRGGIADVLLTNQAVGPGKIARLVEAAAEAASKGGRVAVLVDSEANAADISAAAAERGVVVPAYVEVEAGQGRSGVAASGPALLAVARAVAAAPGLELAGVHCYNGLLQHVRDPADRARRVAEEVVAGSAAAAVAALEAAGLWAPGMVVTGAGTGSFLAEASSGVFTEVQPGSYVFMDADYAKNAWPADVAADVAADAGAGAPPFAQALHLLGTARALPHPQPAPGPSARGVHATLRPCTLQ